ncbi:MAG: hypothetical protein IKI75_02895 [Lachnospiraceae bacterium]|nr:hypothetical protein [Lachnospiraceae bacterium]
MQFELLSNALLALSAAFTLNIIVILLYSRKKRVSDEELLSGSCTDFEIKEPETELRRRKRRLGIF